MGNTLLFIISLFLLDGIYGQEDPAKLRISEIDTVDQDGNGFIEVHTPNVLIQGLDGYSLVVSTRSHWKETSSLVAKHIISLNGATIDENKHFGIVSLGDIGSSGLVEVESFPHPNWKVYGNVDRQKWLEIEDKKFIAVFLLYSPDENVFDHVKFTGKHVYLREELLKFIDSYVIDYVVVRKFNSPNTCKSIDALMKSKQSPKRSILDMFLDEYTGDLPLSINRYVILHCHE